VGILLWQHFSLWELFFCVCVCVNFSQVIFLEITGGSFVVRFFLLWEVFLCGLFLWELFLCVCICVKFSRVNSLENDYRQEFCCENYFYFFVKKIFVRNFLVKICLMCVRLNLFVKFLIFSWGPHNDNIMTHLCVCLKFSQVISLEKSCGNFVVWFFCFVEIVLVRNFIVRICLMFLHLYQILTSRLQVVDDSVLHCGAKHKIHVIVHIQRAIVCSSHIHT